MNSPITPLTPDRELLELAAKAAGFDDAEWHCERECIATAKLPGFRRWWNPLNDSGDALDLAVKLQLDVYCFLGFGEVGAENSDGSKRAMEPLEPDPYAATRRAIVRCAAELGKALP